MTKLIGFIGKGGTGKTTITTLFLKYILSKKIKPVLVIDADPNSSLPDLLAIKIDSTIGTIREELKTNIDNNSISKYDYCEYAINNALYESNGFDLIVMGTHGKTGVEHAILGSVAEKVIRKSPFPVFIIPLREKKAG